MKMGFLMGKFVNWGNWLSDKSPNEKYLNTCGNCLFGILALLFSAQIQPLLEEVVSLYIHGQKLYAGVIVAIVIAILSILLHFLKQVLETVLRKEISITARSKFCAGILLTLCFVPIEKLLVATAKSFDKADHE